MIDPDNLECEFEFRTPRSSDIQSNEDSRLKSRQIFQKGMIALIQNLLDLQSRFEKLYSGNPDYQQHFSQQSVLIHGAFITNFSQDLSDQEPSQKYKQLDKPILNEELFNQLDDELKNQFLSLLPGESRDTMPFFQNPLSSMLSKKQVSLLLDLENSNVAKYIIFYHHANQKSNQAKLNARIMFHSKVVNLLKQVQSQLEMNLIQKKSDDIFNILMQNDKKSSQTTQAGIQSINPVNPINQIFSEATSGPQDDQQKQIQSDSNCQNRNTLLANRFHGKNINKFSAMDLTLNKSFDQNERNIYQQQEEQRYSYPQLPWRFKNSLFQNSVVGPVIKIRKRKNLKFFAMNKKDQIVGNICIKKDKSTPGFITLHCLVRDAICRLPSAMGTVRDIAQLVMMSRYYDKENCSLFLLMSHVKMVLQEISDSSDDIATTSTNRSSQRGVVKQLKQNSNIWIYIEANKTIQSWRKNMEKCKKKRKINKKNKSKAEQIGLSLNNKIISIKTQGKISIGATSDSKKSLTSSNGKLQEID